MLFSFPANCHEVCFLPQTLEDTIRLYIRASLDRDLFHASSVAVRANGDRILAEISGDAAAPYADMLPRFLTVGAGSISLPDPAWQPVDAGSGRHHYSCPFRDASNDPAIPTGPASLGLPPQTETGVFEGWYSKMNEAAGTGEAAEPDDSPEHGDGEL